jgi:N-acetylneuraminic acid mutarotase
MLPNLDPTTLSDTLPVEVHQQVLSSKPYKWTWWKKYSYLGGNADGSTPLSDAYCYDPVYDEWQTLPSMTTSRSDTAGAGLSTPFPRVVVVGGCGEGDELLSSAEMYDPFQNEWKLIAELPVQIVRHTCGTIHSNNNILACGGYLLSDSDSSHQRSYSSGIQNYVWGYDPNRDQWIDMAPLKQERVDHFGASLGEWDYYVLGGYFYPSYNSKILQSVERYDWRTNKWEEVAKLNVGRIAAVVVVWKGEMYVMGGRAGMASSPSSFYNPTIEKYEARMNKWVFVHNEKIHDRARHTAKGWATAGVLDERIYIVGGDEAKGDVRSDEVLVYDEEKENWIAKQKLPKGSGGAASVVV